MQVSSIGRLATSCVDEQCNVVCPHACWHCLTRLFFSRGKKKQYHSTSLEIPWVQELYLFVFSGPEATESAGELVKSLAVAQFIV